MARSPYPIYCPACPSALPRSLSQNSLPSSRQGNHSFVVARLQSSSASKEFLVVGDVIIWAITTVVEKKGGRDQQLTIDLNLLDTVFRQHSGCPAYSGASATNVRLQRGQRLIRPGYALQVY